MKLKALIVDDEKDAANALKLLIEETCGYIKIAGVAASVAESIKFINKEEIAILFLDIEMPGGSGFDLLDLMGEKEPYIIFTTAHSQYAIQAIKQGAKDYLLKPIDPDELVAAVEKARSYLSKEQNHLPSSKSIATLPVATPKGILLLNKTDILYIKADGRYSDIHCADGQHYTICRNIGEFEQDLSTDFFFRVHKSFLINCKHIFKIKSSDGGSVEMSNHKEIEISKRKKAEFLKFLK
ncbi:MAG: response regulator transcription factor [Bacteroidetes bacterium]|jgi:two-component system LytT family response regulator|nr:response regulator transcription factor [Bacteroidota bacterium]